MTSPLWQLENRLAHLQASTLTASVDLLRPAQGLFEVAIGASPDALNNARLLGIEIPSLPPDNASLLDQYVRGRDLVAAYKPSEVWPIRVDVSWRALMVTQLPTPSAALDVLVSVRTEQLDSRPELAVVSVLPAIEVLRLADADSARYERLHAASHSPLAIDKQVGPGCLLFRLPAVGVSYVEMIHPLDFERDELAVTHDETAAHRLRHRLFPQPLEKGVILRARVRGIFVPRQDDERLATVAFTAFAAEEPMLGT